MILFSFTQVKTVRSSAPLYQRDPLLLIVSVTGERPLNMNTHLPCSVCWLAPNHPGSVCLQYFFPKALLFELAFLSEAREEHVFPQTSSSKTFCVRRKYKFRHKPLKTPCIVSLPVPADCLLPLFLGCQTCFEMTESFFEVHGLEVFSDPFETMLYCPL